MFFFVETFLWIRNTPCLLSHFPSTAYTQDLWKFGGKTFQIASGEIGLRKNTLNFLDKVTLEIRCCINNPFLLATPVTSLWKPEKSGKETVSLFCRMKDLRQLKHLYLRIPDLWNPFFFALPWQKGQPIDLVEMLCIFSFGNYKWGFGRLQRPKYPFSDTFFFT